MAIHPTRVLSICSGGAGLDLGYRLAVRGAVEVCFVEHEITAACLLAARFADNSLPEAPIWSDLTTFDGRPWRGSVDSIVGGFPCQGWSYAGKRKGTDDARNLWPAVSRIVGEVQPSECLFENVPGILPYVYGEIRPRLQSMGYRVEVGLFTAAEVGAPHLRQRVFILARKPRNETGRLADANRQGRTPEQARPQQGGQPDTARASGGGAVADAERGGRDGRAPERLRCPEERTSAERPGEPLGNTPDERSDGRGNARRVGDDLVVANRERLQEQRLAIADAPQWPPGPADRDAWQAVMAAHPELAPALARWDSIDLALRRASLPPMERPAIRDRKRGLPPAQWSAETQSAVRRMVDELAAGMGELTREAQLRILGNGVVPAMAARAYGVLSERLGR